MKELLKRTREALADGRLAEARPLLDELGRHPHELFQAGPELANAESYEIPDNFRQLFDDRIEWVNYCIRYAGEPVGGDA